MSISRRTFLETAALTSIVGNAALGAGVDKKTGMPTRILGRTGARVSILAFGCGSRFLGYPDDEKAVEALNRALDLGITYVDTAYSYGNGKSEGRVGKVMKTRRNEVWLATKIQERNGDKAMQIIEGSLKRLETDHLDLIHIHSMSDEADLARATAKDGILPVLYKLRDQKVTRAIGITSHSDPMVLKKALEENDFDCTQMALNAAMVGMVSPKGGMKPNPAHGGPMSFQAIALPVANRKNVGVIAMKVFAQEALNDKAPVEKLISYSLSLPVSAAVVGMPKLEHIDENIRVAKAFKPLAPAEMRELADKLAIHKASIDRFMAHHVDC